MQQPCWKLVERKSRFLLLTLLVSLSACQTPRAIEDADIETEQASSRPALLTAQVNTPITAASTVRARQDDILPAVNPLQVRGDLLIAGSNAMAPLVEVMADRFIDEGFSGELVIERVGSGAGFRIFCEEQMSDIAIASQVISPAEAAACQAAGRQPIALAVGNDALAIVAGEDNSFLEDITRDELTAIFTAEYWSDIRPNWPNELIRRTVPEPGSGALNLFVGELFGGDLRPLLQTPNTDFFSEDEDYLVQALAIDPFAVAFFSYSYYERNRDTLKLVAIDGNRPTDRDTYFLMRPLFLYVDANDMSEKPQIDAFLTHFLTHINEELTTLGYFPLESTRLNETKQTLVKAIGASIDDEPQAEQ